MIGDRFHSSRWLSRFALLAAITAQAQIHLSGPQSGLLPDTTYVVDGPISVSPGDSLTIAAGAVFLFRGYFDFDIHGYVCAAGTESDSIIFSADLGTSGWGGLDFYGDADDNSVFQYLQVSGSKATGLDCWSSHPTFSHCTFTSNSGSMGGGVSLASASPTLEYCVISNNTSNYYGGGIACYNSSPILRHCTITGNVVNNNSTSAYGGGLYCSDGAPLIEDCWFWENMAGLNANGLGGGLYFTYSQPILNNCLIENNGSGTINYGDGGGINCLHTDLTLHDCTLKDNAANNFGGGIFTDLDCVLQVDSCLFYHNVALVEGGGIRSYESTIHLTRCDFTGNSAATIGGAILGHNTNLTLSHCTVAANSAGDFGAAIYSNNLDLTNCILANNSGSSAIYFEAGSPFNLHYNDFHNNTPMNFQGQTPANLGVITGLNANNDPCDPYYNLFLNPDFAALGGDSAYFLMPSSPCLDGGDPTSSQDPDNTVADIGIHYFDQSALPLQVTLTPHNPPIQIPSTGGAFQFDVTLQNLSTGSQTFDAWTAVLLPGGSSYGPLLLRSNITLAPGASLVRPDVSQIIPASAPAGTYSYICNVGTYPNEIMAADAFPVTKQGPWDVEWGDGKWPSIDDLLAAAASEGNVTDIQPANLTATVSPNPYNATTVLSFQLREASFARLDVFDVNGRNVSTGARPASPLHEGWMEPGAHQIAFDGSAWSSGIYFYRLKAGESTTAGKLILLK